MLDFVCELERVVTKWPDEARWNTAQIADATHTGVPQVVDILSDVLGREIEVHETVTKAEAIQVLDALRDRMAVQLAARQRRIEARKEKAMRSYDISMEKVRVLQAAKNWRAAYKTLSYFVGRFEKDVDTDLLLNLCGDCLRLGIKSGANLQELSQWLRKGVTCCLRAECHDSVEDALDFIDAYSDYFMSEETEKGRRLINNMMISLREPVAMYDLVQEYDNLLRSLSNAPGQAKAGS